MQHNRVRSDPAFRDLFEVEVVCRVYCKRCQKRVAMDMLDDHVITFHLNDDDADYEDTVREVGRKHKLIRHVDHDNTKKPAKRMRYTQKKNKKRTVSVAARSRTPQSITISVRNDAEAYNFG